MNEGLRPDSINSESGGDEFALVTGASSGIGACFARALASRGQNLVIVARSKDKLDGLKNELIARNSVRVEVIPQDLSLTGAAAHLTATLTDRGIRVNLLVNNAGFGAQGEFWELPLDRQSEMLRLNIGALTELTHLLLPPMIKRGAGGIINVSSTAGIQPIPYLAVYSATKAFVTSFSMALAEEVRNHGVKVVALCPGATDTNFFAAGQFGRANFVGGLQSPESVVAIGLRALDRGQSLTVTRLYNKFMIFAQRLVSRRFAARMAGNLFKPESIKQS